MVVVVALSCDVDAEAASALDGKFEMATFVQPLR